MKKLIQKINNIPKPYFSFSDIRKIAGMEDASLKVSLSRIVKRGELIRLSKGIYAVDAFKIDWEQFAGETYSPSYISFESALARYNILSQQPASIILATTRRGKIMELKEKTIIYRHIMPRLFWGYEREENRLIAEPEKAFLDLAYLSLNGYAKFDPEEMNLNFLNKKKTKIYLKKFNSTRLSRLMEKIDIN